MKRMVMLVAALCLVGIGSAAWAVDGGTGGLAHNLGGTQGTCSKCHIPHGGKGDKIWAQDISALTQFGGVHTLCYTCHRTGGPYPGLSGNTTVFNLGRYQNHSMLEWATVSGGSASVPAGPPVIFPVSASDSDTIWTVTSWEPESPTGFYCGSCHNPHKQPFTTVNGNGDYLRVDTNHAANITAFGTSGRRTGACTQCHPTQAPTGTLVSSGHTTACMICHNPHQGADFNTPANARLSEKILVASGLTNPFIATPNVPGFTPGSYAEQIAGMCYYCHSQAARLGGGTTKVIYTTLEHHPMGTNAPGADGADHAPGYTTTFAGAEMTCTSCHDPHDGEQDFYLKSTAGIYTGAGTDDGRFCVSECHNNKTVAALSSGTKGGHLELKASSPVTVLGDEGGTGQGECFMCHAIHDGPSRPDTELPQLSAMMRAPAINLARARKFGTATTLDYEDLCNGCHNNNRTRTYGVTGSTLATSFSASIFSHLFTGTASAGVTANMTANSIPFAPADKVQYGAVQGEIYCGSCHNVHVQNATDTQGQMFIKEHFGPSAKGQLCLDCHGVAPLVGGTATGGSHPIGAAADLPTAGVTAATTPSQYGNGGDGAPGGRTELGVPGTGPALVDNMVCETCHNFHTSVTNRVGGTVGETVGALGKLMIQNNSASGLCANCHTSY